ncbi:unnamed protein product [Mytilus coruscus]|uniref:Ribonuclease H1 N-terminal domain-containing protein n=1 Tax=Mytilus coruscus TaxID=42192 RepID=A0A6J8BNE6_MYTCO|nr:unnamed protein product [Mytilus coruscus]
MSTKKFYSVARGVRIGIFTKWSRCEQSVHRFKHTVFKGFTSMDQAVNFLLAGSKFSSCNQIPVFDETDNPKTPEHVGHKCNGVHCTKDSIDDLEGDDSDNNCVLHEQLSYNEEETNPKTLMIDEQNEQTNSQIEDHKCERGKQLNELSKKQDKIDSKCESDRPYFGSKIENIVKNQHQNIDQKISNLSKENATLKAKLENEKILCLLTRKIDNITQTQNSLTDALDKISDKTKEMTDTLKNTCEAMLIYAKSNETKRAMKITITCHTRITQEALEKHQAD